MERDLGGLLTRTQAAQLANCSAERIDMLRKLGKLHPVESQLGRLYDPEEVERFTLRRELVPA